MSKRTGDWPKVDRYIFTIALLAAMFSWPWIVGIILYGDAPEYVKQACALFLGGVSVAWYYDKVKHSDENSD